MQKKLTSRLVFIAAALVLAAGCSPEFTREQRANLEFLGTVVPQGDAKPVGSVPSKAELHAYYLSARSGDREARKLIAAPKVILRPPAVDSGQTDWPDEKLIGEDRAGGQASNCAVFLYREKVRETGRAYEAENLLDAKQMKRLIRGDIILYKLSITCDNV